MQKLTLPKTLKELPSGDIRSILAALWPLILIIFLSFFLARFVFSKITEQRGVLVSTTRTENILNEKLSILNSVQADAREAATLAAYAIPGTNSAPAVLSQLKSLSSENSVILADIKIGAEAKGKNDLSQVKMQFDLDGAFPQIISFLNSLSESLPLIQAESVDISLSASGVRATVTLVHLFKPFPEKLPPLTEPIKDITATEREILIKLVEFRQPPFVEVVPQAEPITREDPFQQ